MFIMDDSFVCPEKKILFVIYTFVVWESSFRINTRGASIMMIIGGSKSQFNLAFLVLRVLLDDVYNMQLY